MILEWGYEDLVSRFAERGGFHRRDFGECRVLWGFDGDDVLGCVVVHDWNTEAETAEISALSTDGRFPNRRVAREVCGYVFGFCQAVYCRTKNDNVRRWARSLGADEHILPRMGGRAASEALLILTDDAWRQSRWAGRT